MARRGAWDSAKRSSTPLSRSSLTDQGDAYSESGYDRSSNSPRGASSAKRSSSARSSRDGHKIQTGYLQISVGCHSLDTSQGLFVALFVSDESTVRHASYVRPVKTALAGQGPMEAGVEFVAQYELEHKALTGQVMKFNVYNDQNKLLATATLGMDGLVEAHMQSCEYRLKLAGSGSPSRTNDPTLVIRKDKVILFAPSLRQTSYKRTDWQAIERQLAIDVNPQPMLSSPGTEQECLFYILSKPNARRCYGLAHTMFTHTVRKKSSRKRRQLQLTVTCQNLPSADVNVQMNPVVVLGLKSFKTGRYEQVASTETVTNSHNPLFKKKLLLPYSRDDLEDNSHLPSNQRAKIKLTVFDSDWESPRDLIGGATIYLSELLSNIGQLVSHELYLHNRDGTVVVDNSGATIMIMVEESSDGGNNQRDRLTESFAIDVKCRKLHPTNSNQKSPPSAVVALYIKNDRTGNFEYACQTERVIQSKNPVFEHQLRLSKVQVRALDAYKEVLLCVYDAGDVSRGVLLSREQLIGVATISLTQLIWAKGEELQFNLYTENDDRAGQSSVVCSATPQTSSYHWAQDDDDAAFPVTGSFRSRSNSESSLASTAMETPPPDRYHRSLRHHSHHMLSSTGGSSRRSRHEGRRWDRPPRHRHGWGSDATETYDEGYSSVDPASYDDPPARHQSPHRYASPKHRRPHRHPGRDPYDHLARSSNKHYSSSRSPLHHRTPTSHRTPTHRSPSRHSPSRHTPHRYSQSPHRHRSPRAEASILCRRFSDDSASDVTSLCPAKTAGPHNMESGVCRDCGWHPQLVQDVDDRLHRSFNAQDNLLDDDPKSLTAALQAEAAAVRAEAAANAAKAAAEALQAAVMKVSRLPNDKGNNAEESATEDEESNYEIGNCSATAGLPHNFVEGRCTQCHAVEDVDQILRPDIQGQVSKKKAKKRRKDSITNKAKVWAEEEKGYSSASKEHGKKKYNQAPELPRRKSAMLREKEEELTKREAELDRRERELLGATIQTKAKPKKLQMQTQEGKIMELSAPAKDEEKYRQETEGEESSESSETSEYEYEGDEEEEEEELEADDVKEAAEESIQLFFSCKSLPAHRGNTTGLPNPMVKVSVENEPSKKGANFTEHFKGTSDPDFLNPVVVTKRGVANPRLKLKVFDVLDPNTMDKEGLLGEAIVSLSQITESEVPIRLALYKDDHMVYPDPSDKSEEPNEPATILVWTSQPSAALLGAKTPVSLYVSCRNLGNLNGVGSDGVVGACNPLVGVFITEPKNGRYVYSGNTDFIEGDRHPDFVRAIETNAFENVDRGVKFNVYSVTDPAMIGTHNLLGTAVCSLSTIQRSEGILSLALSDKDGHPVLVHTHTTPPR